MWFTKHLVRPVAWSKKGTTATVPVRGINLSILGCICSKGLVTMSQQVPQPLESKKRKVPGGKKEGVVHGTSGAHFLLFIEDVMNGLNEHKTCISSWITRAFIVQVCY